MTDNKENSANPSFFDRVRGQSDSHFPSSPSPDLEKGTDSNSDEEAEAIDAPGGDSDGGLELPHEARRVLVYLMRQGAVIGTQKPKVFESLCRYESQIRRHLAEVYLRLHEDAATFEVDITYMCRVMQGDTEHEGNLMRKVLYRI